MAVLANRPDLIAAEYRFQKAFKDVRAAQKAWYSSISLGAMLSSSSDSVHTMFDVPFTRGMLSINLPFLQWNAVKWNIKIWHIGLWLDVISCPNNARRRWNARRDAALEAGPLRKQPPAKSVAADPRFGNASTPPAAVFARPRSLLAFRR